MTSYIRAKKLKAIKTRKDTEQKFRSDSQSLRRREHNCFWTIPIGHVYVSGRCVDCGKRESTFHRDRHCFWTRPIGHVYEHNICVGCNRINSYSKGTTK